MKYFTYELWKAMQSEHSEIAARQWTANGEAYRTGFQKLDSCLNKKVLALFSKAAFHDGVVTVIDTAISETITLTIQKRDAQYSLVFKGVRAWSFQFDSQQDHLSFGQMLEWGYDELTKIAENLVKLEVLFSSGATCSIEFMSLQIHKMVDSNSKRTTV